MDTNINIFYYWCGRKYSLIKLCHKIFKKKLSKYNLIFLNDDNIDKYIDNVDFNKLNKLCPAHKADYIRVNVLYKYGGIWLDSDTLIINNLDYYINILKNYDVFLVYEEPDLLCNGFFGCKKNILFMQEWKQRINNILEDKDYNISWNEIGSDIIGNISKKYDNIYYIDGYKGECLINWKDSVNILNSCNYNYDVGQDVIFLYNSLYKFYDNVKEDEIKEKNNLLGHFIKKSLCDKKEYENEKIIIYSGKNYLADELENLGWLKIPLNEYLIYKYNNNIIFFDTNDNYKIDDEVLDYNYVIYKLDELYTNDNEKFEQRIINTYKVDCVISPYTYLLEKNKYYKYKDIFNIHNSISSSKLKNIFFNNKPINKILISGQVDYENITPYSFNYYMKEISKKYNNIDYICDPSLIELNKYLCCFCDSTDYGYVQEKIFKILSVGSLLLCDEKIEEELKKIGLINMVNYISINPHNFLERISYILNNKNINKINEIRNNGYIISQFKYTDKIAKKIDNYFSL